MSNKVNQQGKPDHRSQPNWYKVNQQGLKGTSMSKPSAKCLAAILVSGEPKDDGE